jgi:hypothetical protein
MRKVAFAALAADFPMPAAAVAAPAEVAKVMAKKIIPAPTPGAFVDVPAAVAAAPTAVVKISGAVIGAPAPVAESTKAPVVAAPVEVAKVMAKKVFLCQCPGQLLTHPQQLLLCPQRWQKFPGQSLVRQRRWQRTRRVPVAKKAKVAKESAPGMADVATPVPVPVAKATWPKENVPGPFHPYGVVVEFVGTEMVDRGHSCEEHPNNCGEVLADDVVVRLRKVQIVVDGREETAIGAYWVSDRIDCYHVGFLPCHMVKHVARYNGVLAQVTRVFSNDPMCSDTAERCMFHKNKGCCLAAIIAWRSRYNK